jgi:hypothetical protein
MDGWCSFYSELKTWQTGIAALFGLAGLAGAAFWNAQLNRQRDKAIRDAEANSVALALYGEMLLLQEALARLARNTARIENAGNQPPDDFVETQNPVEVVVFSALADKLGLLPSEMAFAVTKFYGHLAETRIALPFIVQRHEGIRYSPIWVLEKAVAAVDGIAPTLRTIELNSKLPEAPHPDTGLASDLIEIQREAAEEYDRR